MTNGLTPHNQGEMGDFAKTVLMPGDPKRSRFIAENYLEGAVLVNDVRGVQGYTGTYKGVNISVMSSGMGMPSIGIYSYELFNFYGVDNIIRVGTAGAISDDLKIRDIVLGMGACTNSSYLRNLGIAGNFAPIASYDLLEQAVIECRKRKVDFKVGNLLSSDVFYNEGEDPSWKRMGVLAVEMESAALYANALRAGRNALTICTISDIPSKNVSTDAEERRSAFTDMMEIALEVGIKL
ncbi:MAG: purine-nucleoside phosphorylase [Clostridia bacterium]|nr:purine-nucleoside phosphorylase [Clostridia bacterium]